MDKKGQAGGLVAGFIAILIAVIVAVGVALPVVTTTIDGITTGTAANATGMNESAIPPVVSGTTSTILNYLPMMIAIVLFVAVAGMIYLSRR